MQVILLSRILEKLERMEKRMDKIETRVEEIAGTAVGKMPGQAGHDGKRKDIRDYIRVPEKADEILAQLHRWIDKTYRVKALVYIKAAIEAKVLTRPPFVVANAEFPGHMGGQSLYYVYTGEPMAFASEEDLEEMKKAVAVLTCISRLP